VDFEFDGNEIRGLEQNPETKSQWAQLARSDKKVMQFLSDGRYVANAVDGKVTVYGGRGKEVTETPQLRYGDSALSDRNEHPASATWTEQLAAIERSGFVVQN
jgi:hypothetical protein